jgi:hypothetical protein
MSASVTVARAVAPAQDKERGHRSRVAAGYFLFATLIVSLSVYGWDYYVLSSEDRPFSPKHLALRPSGAIGLKLGFLGLIMFLIIFLYPLRKHWSWLMKKGSSKHWLDYHVILGIAAPFVIAFHASFKFHGFAGMAFWIMLAVSLSGVIGRYLYAQIPHNLSTAELSRKELQETRLRLAEQLQGQRLVSEEELRALLRMPSPQRVAQLSMASALVYMFALDIARVFRIAQLRRHSLTFGRKITTLGGLLKTRKPGLEKVIEIAREEASLSKRILFLARSRQVFNLWHVVHKPFSYSFAVLALMHIVVVTMLGFVTFLR